MNRPWVAKQRWLLAVGCVSVVAAAAALTFAFTPGPGGRHSQGEPARVVPGSSVAAPEPARTDLTASFAELRSWLHAGVGVAVRAVGDETGDAMTFGDWASGPAWSTIKVPLAIAGLRQQDSGQGTPEMTTAITRSDNAAAESIWAGLGEPATAGAAVEAVLRATGDPTAVQTRKVRPEYSAFGQTEWSLANQTRFLASAACDPADQPVLQLMGQVEDSQKWGLGAIPGSRIKGGWGPSPEGRYLVRQIAVLPTPRGSTAVAMAVEPESGEYADGVAGLTELAGWIRAHIEAVPSGSCRQ